MKKTFGIAVLGCLCLGLAGAEVALAQDDDGPAPRYVTVTSFDLPFNDRAVVMPFIRRYFYAGTQLNPNVKSARLLLHNWGSNASQVVMVAEYDSWNAIEADCGKPCDDYYGEGGRGHAPEEGEAGYDEYHEAQQLFSKYYAHHKDEIYAAPGNWLKVEGRNMGPIGGPADDE